MCFSFFYTEKTVSVVKEHDSIMIEIKEEMDKFKIDAVDAEIIDNTIKPGIHGSEVDIDKSYSKMKKYGKYNESLLVKKEVLPNISIKDNYDKFVIGGNDKKNQVTLIFLATNNIDVSKILDILKQKDIEATFFIDFYFYNVDVLKTIASFNHEIGNLSLNYDYNDSSFSWLTTKIKRLVDTTYCYDDSYNQDTLLICSASKLYTIKPSIITDTRPLLEVKKQVQNGSIISFHINEFLEQELGLVINYLKSKNYDIVSLSKLLEE